MSIDINWESLTQGPDGDALAESIRAFIDDRFQKVTLPRMIRSVKVHSFDFGEISPKVELKDICEPLPDFYQGEDDEDDGDLEDSEQPAPKDIGDQNGKLGDQSGSGTFRGSHTSTDRHERSANLPSDTQHRDGPGVFNRRDILGGQLLPRATTPGILGGTSNLGYFHLPLSAGLSGTTTPLAAVAGAQFHNTLQDTSRGKLALGDADQSHNHHRSMSFGSLTHSSATTPSSRPTSRHQHDWPEEVLDGSSSDGQEDDSPKLVPGSTTQPERSIEDVQIVFHVSYAGNVKLSLTAEILLDYPMPSFVGIPLQLNITGLTFDGVGILAYIKKKAHFCFLCPEDAEALVGDSQSQSQDDDEAAATAAAAEKGNSSSDTTTTDQRKQRPGALLEEIRVESEIGQRESGKQVLKNVGKVEKFVLEQVRRIFDEEFVYPSFWTFLV
ncbi:hypothetical protein AAFC00_003511 [Neodothiora populina]|uniref:Mitochondrial distribution and morphology protein 12 n=1 Tax=Neodothiora populina TaxID=2781224 RepID=A0ABR3PEE9_9PEZI